MRATMTKGAGIVRTDAGLRETIGVVEALLRDYEGLPSAPYSQHPRETHNLLRVAEAVTKGAFARRENVGLHYSLDLIPPAT